MSELLEAVDKEFSHLDHSILKCHVCKNESKGGRLTCCGLPICYSCFHNMAETLPKPPNLHKHLGWSDPPPFCTSCSNPIGYVRLNETISGKQMNNNKNKNKKFP